MNQLKPSTDRKTRAYKTQKNTFGLLPGVSCPGATSAKGGCRFIAEGRKLPTCYVDALMCAYKGVKNSLTHNTELLMDASYEQKVQLLDDEFKRFTAIETRRHDHDKTSSLNYRLHWSGDVFNEEYARAIAEATTANTQLEFWNYTRSLFAVPLLCDIPNLNQYISLDIVNFKEGMEAFNTHNTDENRLQICFMSKEVEEYEKHRKKWHFDDAQLRGCPVDRGLLELEGGCAKCKLCTMKKPKPVWFRV